MFSIGSPKEDFSALLDLEIAKKTNLVRRYAADAYAIFYGRKPHEVYPHDKQLVLYWKFVCNMRNPGEETQGLPSQPTTNA
ncbi:hypothetical protein J5N97_013126 [Dioscorea zingiberensis]|uniref:Uncharacterized protein n=1 Tax=Dioscorea zingiberensis TaxID=325984 RepID=A0A9D5CSD0_9LILI|nr:hypothetical protein J5N97_013126 [Dioscorea zingiberensis]